MLQTQLAKIRAWAVIGNRADVSRFRISRKPRDCMPGERETFLVRADLHTDSPRRSPSRLSGGASTPILGRQNLVAEAMCHPHSLLFSSRLRSHLHLESLEKAVCVLHVNLFSVASVAVYTAHPAGWRGGLPREIQQIAWCPFFQPVSQ